MRWALFAVATLQLVGMLHLVTQVGKPRQAITPVGAAAGVLVSAAVIAILVTAGVIWP